MAVVKKTTGEDVGEEEPYKLLVGMQTTAATVEISVEGPRKLKVERRYGPGIPLLGIYPEVSRHVLWRDLSICVYSSTVHNR